MVQTPTEALRAAIAAHQTMAEASRQAGADVAAEREAARAKAAAEAELSKPPAPAS